MERFHLFLVRKVGDKLLIAYLIHQVLKSSRRQGIASNVMAVQKALLL